jgi:hypothetical protein
MAPLIMAQLRQLEDKFILGITLDILDNIMALQDSSTTTSPR